MKVEVGGRGVNVVVGGTGVNVAVDGRDVNVAVGGTGVNVAVGGRGVLVGGTAVSVGGAVGRAPRLHAHSRVQATIASIRRCFTCSPFRRLSSVLLAKSS